MTPEEHSSPSTRRSGAGPPPSAASIWSSLFTSAYPGDRGEVIEGTAVDVTDQPALPEPK
jgi:hypothetical protein